MPPTERQRRVVADSMLGLHLPDVSVWSERVVTVLGQNPGPFTGPGTNTYLVGTSSRPLLIDAGDGRTSYPPLLRGALADHRRGRGIEALLVTHAHPDHLGGWEAVRAELGQLAIRKRPWPGRDGAAAEHIEPIADGAVVATEGATLRAIHTPGHAEDHLCFWLEEERALFTGDLVLGAGTTVIPDEGGDLLDYLASLRRILALEPRRIYPAHGPRIDDAAAKIRAYIAHRELREEQVLDQLRRGVARVPEMVRRIYDDVPEFLHAAAASSVRAHLRKLEREGRARRDGEDWHLSEAR